MNKKVNNKIKSKKDIVITIIDYIFLISLFLSIIFGIQKNTSVFFVPFVIVVLITVICMGVIIINALYEFVKKKFKK